MGNKRREGFEGWVVCSKILFKCRIKDKDILSVATVHGITVERKEDFEDHLFQPLHFAAKGVRPGESHQDHTAGGKSRRSCSAGLWTCLVHVSQVTPCTYKSTYDL